MKNIIVSDATPVIAFSRIQKLEILWQITGEIIIPEEVSRELFEYKPDTEMLCAHAWIKIQKVKSRNDVELLLPVLDRGEAEVIILAKEIKADLVIIDELSARKIAAMMDLPIIGTVGLLMAAKERGIIQQIKPLLDEMIAKGIRYGDRFYRRIMKETGEDTSGKG